MYAQDLRLARPLTVVCFPLGSYFYQKNLFPFPSRQQVIQWMPKCFSKVKNTRIIIDCYEVECQRPSGLMNSSVTYSQYKSRNTWKVLVGCTPTGLVSFISGAWGGRISDKELSLDC